MKAFKCETDRKTYMGGTQHEVRNFGPLRLSGCVEKRLPLKIIAEKAGVRTQDYRNRADIPGGSTLGRISLAQISVPTADIGLAQLAMHSAFETASAKDAGDLLALMRAYYSSALERTEDGCRVI